MDQPPDERAHPAEPDLMADKMVDVVIAYRASAYTGQNYSLSELGQSRRLGPPSMTSGLPP